MSSGLQPQLTPLLPQGFVLLPKSECDVREVEFARCLRLRQTSLEPVAFRLPRVRVRLDPHSLTPSPHPSPSGALGPGWPCHETAPLAALWGTCTPSYAEIQKPQTGVPGLAILPPPPTDATVPWALVSASGQPPPPSMQKEFFQDDVFPDTAITWEPVLSAKAWLEGANGQPRLLSLQPPGMTPGRMRDRGASRKQGSG